MLQAIPAALPSSEITDARPSRPFARIAGALTFALTLPCVAPATLAQVPRVYVAPGTDLRAITVNAADVAEGRRLAQSSCAACHGLTGVSTVSEVPSLAGQRAGYLYLELRAYQSGARGNSTMASVVKFVRDDALVDVAAYYAGLPPPPPLATPGAATETPAQGDPLAAGKAAAAPCAGCHGEDGISKTPGTPSLVGLDPKYIVAAVTAYKGGHRHDDTMVPMASALSETELGNVALFYALQKPARAPTPAQGDRAAGKAASTPCAGCHGDTGTSVNPAIPSLAGQDAAYLDAALHAYKSGARSDETMKGPAAPLDDATMRNLAAYYASQSPQAPHVAKPLTTAEWAQRCDRCHGAGGNSVDPRLPALAGQREDYLRKVLHDYRTGARKSPQMAAMSEGLTETAVDDLAAYYARQPARAAVYVIVPATGAR